MIWKKIEIRVMSGGWQFYQINYSTPTYISCWNFLKGVLDTGTPHDKESRKINFTSFTRWGMTKRSQVNVRSHTGEGVDPLRPLDTILSPPLHRWLVFHIIHYPAATLIPRRTVMAFHTLRNTSKSLKFDCQAGTPFTSSPHTFRYQLHFQLI